MTMFIVRVAGTRCGGSLCGTVRHAATEETRSFTNAAELVSLLEEWHATRDLRAMLAEFRESPGQRRSRPRAVSRRTQTGPDAPPAGCC